MRVLNKFKKEKFYYLVILAIFIIDYLTKLWITKKIPPYYTKEIIKGFFNLTHIHNRGAIFGFFANSENPYIFIFLTILSLGAFIFIIYYFLRIPITEKYLKTSLSLILGGAFGNLFDRLLRGYVVDFFDFYIGKYHWPAFNIADSSITIGAIILIIIIFFRRPKCTLCS
jgi:signal peptidase II